MDGKQLGKNKAAVSKQPPVGSGARFAALKTGVASEYAKKGFSPNRAAKIGAAVAAKQGRAKFGASKMSAMAATGRRQAGAPLRKKI